MTNATNTIARADLIAAAQQAAENRDTLNVGALKLYISEVAEALPEAIPVTTTARELEKLLLNNATSWHRYCGAGCPAIVGTFEVLARHHASPSPLKCLKATMPASARSMSRPRICQWPLSACALHCSSCHWSAQRPQRRACECSKRGRSRAASSVSACWT